MKRLIVCCDGTWNSADQQSNHVPCPTNVIKMAYRVAKSDGAVAQLIFYDQGVGTGNFVDRVSGGAFGGGLIDNIFDGYRFLIANYEPGDELFVFGFSRGAFTARSLCGMVRKCGILRRESVMHYHEALELYRLADVHPDDDRARDFRREHGVTGEEPIGVTFLGVWDTVGALGIPLRGLRWLTRRKYQFHDTELSGCVKRAWQALAIDEHRGPFAPTLWDYVPKPGQQVQQTWFIGAHSDVGGGYPDSGLSDIALEWMIEGARQAGLAFDERVMAAHPLKPDPLAGIHDSRKGIYRVVPSIDRLIGRCSGADAVADPTQAVHETVMERWSRVSTYRPCGLAEFLGTGRGAGALA